MIGGLHVYILFTLGAWGNRRETRHLHEALDVESTVVVSLLLDVSGFYSAMSTLQCHDRMYARDEKHQADSPDSTRFGVSHRMPKGEADMQGISIRYEVFTLESRGRQRTRTCRQEAGSRKRETGNGKQETETETETEE